MTIAFERGSGSKLRKSNSTSVLEKELWGVTCGRSKATSVMGKEVEVGKEVVLLGAMGGMLEWLQEETLLPLLLLKEEPLELVVLRRR